MARPVRRVAVCLSIACMLVPAAAPAQKAPSGATYDLSITPLHQFRTGIDNGGEFSFSAAMLRFKVTRPVARQVSAGLSLKFNYDDYEFTGDGLSGAGPWEEVQRLGIGVPVFARLGDAWLLGATPSVDWLQEPGAEDGESLSYGTTLFAFKSLGRHRRLGLGAGVFRGIDDDTRFFPVLAVDWRFNEHWRLANPFDADALGPAGLELSYRFDDVWRLGGGGVYRSFRFRLDDRGVAPDGIGENEAFAAFIRLQRQPDTGPALDVYLGALVDGRLELEDAAGNRIAAAGYETAPFAAVTVSAEF